MDDGHGHGQGGGRAMLRSGVNGDCDLPLPEPGAEETLSEFRPVLEPLPSLVGSEVSSSDAESSVTADDAVPLREPLRFFFSGLTVWLHLEQHSSDLDRALRRAAERDGLAPIPAPHVTVIYGMTHLDEREVRRRFRAGVREAVGGVEGGWPPMRAKGLLCDRTWDGVDGENMDMAWMEITLATSPAHESLVDAVHDVFHHPSPSSSYDRVDGDDGLDGEGDPPGGDPGPGRAPPPPRARPWTPHLSLAYDNPDDGTPLSLGAAVRLTSEFPTLLDRAERAVTAISLWRTEGRMEEWAELERIDLGPPARPEVR